MNPLGRSHPMVILLYYVLAVVLMTVVSHPLVNGMIWVMSLFHYFSLVGIRKGVRMVWYSLGTAALCLILNPLLNHRGVTLICVLGEQRITWEAALYGMHMAMLLLASLLLFSCFSHLMTAQKIMTLMGKRMPSFALLFSMILRSVPKAGRDFRMMSSLHGNSPSMWSALMGMVLVDSVARSLSMKSRHYGSDSRSSYYYRRMKGGEICLCLLLVVAAVVPAAWQELGGLRVRFFPSVRIDCLPVGIWIILFVFYSLPLLWRGKEELSWYLSRRRIIGSSIPEKKSRRWT